MKTTQITPGLVGGTRHGHPKHGHLAQFNG
jgi:hypothetical protein